MAQILHSPEVGVGAACESETCRGPREALVQLIGPRLVNYRFTSRRLGVPIARSCNTSGDGTVMGSDMYGEGRDLMRRVAYVVNH